MTNKTVMVVDDVESNRVLLKMILEDDYDIVECEDGPSCLAAIDQQVPDIVLLDINMPEMTGYEVCKHIRKNTQTATLPVIFVSAMDTPEEKLAGFEAGGNDFLVKPVDAVVLEQKVSETLNQHKQEQAEAEVTLETVKTTSEQQRENSEIGIILNFLGRTHHVNSLDVFADECMNAVKEFGLEAQLTIHVQPQIFRNCTSDSMEAKVLNKFLSSSDSMVVRGKRVLAKSDDFAIMISNMPTQDETRCRRIQEYMNVLSCICGGRILSMKQQAIKPASSLDDLLPKHLEEIEASTAERISTLQTDITDLDLDESHKEFLINEFQSINEQIANRVHAIRNLLRNT